MWQDCNDENRGSSVLVWSIGTDVKRRADSTAIEAIIEGFAPDLACVQN